MDGGTFPFVAGCIFSGFGVLLIGSLLQSLWQRTRWRGRATGSIVAIDTVSGAEAPRTIARLADDVPDDAAALQRRYRPVVAYAVGGRQYQVNGPYAPRSSTTRTTIGGGTATSEVRIDRLSYDTGQSMSVGYERTNPSNAIVIDVRRELMVAAAQIFCGVMCMVLGLLAFYWNGNLAWLGPDWHR
jgi:Protein of unknown function (DUF3592)